VKAKGLETYKFVIFKGEKSMGNKSLKERK